MVAASALGFVLHKDSLLHKSVHRSANIFSIFFLFFSYFFPPQIGVRAPKSMCPQVIRAHLRLSEADSVPHLFTHCTHEANYGMTIGRYPLFLLFSRMGP
ncbi:hypothetical protein M758_10G098600 [Ceratodon purpureus]|nr:hypothetical protein M758_10G098600 [Ceratodon purpureus]